jgi:ABC-type multidrug transport system fused ATPase/permease subunit
MPRRAISSSTPTGCSTPQREIPITSEPAPAPQTVGPQRSLWRLFKAHFWPQKAWFIGGTALALLTALWGIGYVAVLDFVGTSLQFQITGEGGGPREGWIWIGIIAIIGLTFARSLSMYGMTLLNNTGVQRGLVSVQTVQYDALTDGDFARVSADTSGSFVARFISDIISIREAALRFANSFTKSLATVLGVLAWLFWKDWQLALIIVVVYPLALGPVLSLGNAVRKRAKTAAEQIGEVTSLLSEGFQSARIVKAYGLETWQKERAKQGFIQRSHLFLKVLSKRAGVDPVLEVFGGLALAALLAVDLVLGGAHLSRSVLGAGEAGDVLDVLDRRLTLMTNTFIHPVYPELLAVSVVLIAVAVIRRRVVLAWFGDAWAARCGFLGALAGVLVGTVANDSGSVLLVIGTIYLSICAGFFWAILPPRRADPEPG